MASVNVSDITTKSSFLQKQNDDTFEKLTKIFDSGDSTSAMIKDLEALTIKRFGIRLNISDAKEVKITDFILVDGSLELQDFDKLKLDVKTLEKEQTKAKKYSADVDYKKLKLSGDLANVTVKLDFDFSKRLVYSSAEQTAGLFLYCVGTAFSALSSIHKTKLLNKLFSDLEMSEDKEKAFKELQNLLAKLDVKVSEEEVNELLGSDGKLDKVKFTLLFSKTMKSVNIDFSSIKDDAEDFTSSFTNEIVMSYKEFTVLDAGKLLLIVLRVVISLVLFYWAFVLAFIGGISIGIGAFPIGIPLVLIAIGLNMIALWVFPDFSKKENTNGSTTEASVVNNLSKAFPDGVIGKINIKSDFMLKVSEVYTSGTSAIKKIFSLEDITSYNLAFESADSNIVINMPMLPNLARKNVATEVIDFQHDDFGTKLEALITTISSKINDGSYRNELELSEEKEILDIEALVEKRLGLKIKIRTNYSLAAIMPFYSNKNHIFADAFWRGNFEIKDQEKLLKKLNGKEGSVDLAKAKVGGIFSEYIHETHFHFVDLVKVIQLSPAEITGIFLHELGHAFYTCEYSDRLESVNQVLANVATEVLSKKSKDLNYVYRELEKVNPNVTKEEVEILLGDNRVIAGTKWFETIIGTVKYQLNNAKYDESASEQTADNFASRFGYGRAVIIGLDKLHKLAKDPATSKKAMMQHQILVFISLIGVMAIISAMIITVLPLGLIMSFLFGMIFRLSGDDMLSFEYDELKQRYIRLRNDTVELLKSDKLSKERAKYVLEDLYIMDSVIKETQNFSNVFTGLSNFVFGEARRTRASVAEQQLLESLITNDLFVQAARLKLA